MQKYEFTFSLQELTSALDELGLSSSEKELYLASLSSGPQSIPELGKRLGFERPYVYTLIKSLREKGLAVEPLTRKYQRTFVVEPPTVVLLLLRKKKANLENLTAHIAMDMPKYLASYRQGGSRTQVLFYEGKDKFIELYERIVEEEMTETLYFGEVEHYFLLLGEERVNQWIFERIQKKIKIRTLMVDSDASRKLPSMPEMFRETRLLPLDMNKEFPASFQVFGTNVIFWQPETPIAVVLQDEYIAKLHRGIFAMLWKQGKEYHSPSDKINKNNC